MGSKGKPNPGHIIRAYLLSVKSLEELAEVALGVMWARRRLRMVLNGENRVLPMPDSFYGTIIEVKVGDLKRLRTGYTRRVPLDRKSVVLRRDKYFSCREIPHGMVTTAVPVGEFDRVSPQGKTEQLMPQANPEDRDGPRGIPRCAGRGSAALPAPGS